MSLRSNSKEAVTEDAIKEAVKYNDAITQDYLVTRQKILDLSQQIIDDGLTSTTKVQLAKLQYELEQAWENYKGHLVEIKMVIDVIKNIPSTNLHELNKQQQFILSQKIRFNNKLNNIKSVQIPLIDDMKSLQTSYEKNIHHGQCLRFSSKEKFDGTLRASKPQDIDINQLKFTRPQIEGLMATITTDINQHKTIFDDQGGINIEEHIDKKLLSLFLAMDDDYIFKVANTRHDAMQDYSVDDYDNLIEGVTQEIIESIDYGTTSKQSWLTHADMIQQFQAIIDGQNQNP